jgi:hypothetical protein
MYGRGKVVGRRGVIATLWLISFDEVAKVASAAAQLLDVCAYYAPQPIPLDLFTTNSVLPPQSLTTTVNDGLAFVESVAILVGDSVVTRTTAGLVPHRLMQCALRVSHQQQDQAPPWQQLALGRGQESYAGQDGTSEPGGNPEGTA